MVTEWLRIVKAAIRQAKLPERVVAYAETGPKRDCGTSHRNSPVVILGDSEIGQSGIPPVNPFT